MLLLWVVKHLLLYLVNYLFIIRLSAVYLNHIVCQHWRINVTIIRLNYYYLHLYLFTVICISAAQRGEIKLVYTLDRAGVMK